MKLTKKKTLISVLAIVLVSLVLVGFQTNAFLHWVSDSPVINRFKLDTPKTIIEEEFDGTVKKNIVIKNDSSVDVYVRVALIPRWRENETGNLVYDDLSSIEGLDFSVDEQWIKVDDYYYFKERLNKGNETSDLLNGKSIMAPVLKDRTFELDVIVQSIEASEHSSFQEAWTSTQNEGISS